MHDWNICANPIITWGARDVKSLCKVQGLCKVESLEGRGLANRVRRNPLLKLTDWLEARFAWRFRSVLAREFDSLADFAQALHRQTFAQAAQGMRLERRPAAVFDTRISGAIIERGKSLL